MYRKDIDPSSKEPSLIIACRGTAGINFIHGPPREGMLPKFPGEKSPSCREMVFSKDGTYFAWCNGKKVNIGLTSFRHLPFDVLHELDLPKTMFIRFSPKGTFLATWEPYIAQENQQLSCNLRIWETKTGKCIKAFIQKKQTFWCPAWSDDELICVRSVNNEVHFFENSNFDTISKKIFLQKVSAFSLAPSGPNYHIACYVPGVKGQPSFVRLFKFPNFEGANAVIAQKSFYKADKAEFSWNNQGQAVIVQAILEVDKTGASYYGEQNLYYLSVKGDTARVMLDKDGPVYAVQWDPNSTCFCVVYGFMPAKATIYNLKCDAIFDFGTGPRNEVHYTQTGNRLILCGFGNLRGHVEVWDLEDYKKISNFIASDSTCLHWSPDGEYILTGTTSPRIRIGNGYRIWHYTGSLLREVFADENEDIHDLQWMPITKDKIKVKKTVYQQVPGIQSAVAQASKQVYRPPSARDRPSTFKLHDDEPAQKDSAQPMSKNKKKNLARKAKKDQDKNADSIKEVQKQETVIPEHEPRQKVVAPPPVNDLTGDPEKDKRIKALLKKIDQIEKLKKDKASGKQLEKNQIEKISKEQEILEELKQMQL